MVLIFGRRQHHLPAIDIARIDVDRPRHATAFKLARQQSFGHVGFQLTFGQLIRRHETAKAHPLPQQCRAHLVLIKL